MTNVLVVRVRNLNDAMEPNIVASGKYRHYKGHEYEVIGVAKNSETLEELVIYRALSGNHEYWVRPLNMFMETVEIDGKRIPRFAKLNEAT